MMGEYTGRIILKDELEAQYASILKPYAAARPREGSREVVEEQSEDNRTSFQRDRDRIIHTKAFRRLMYKTQVFVNYEGDHFRTRLTHTLEVAQMARGICRSLGLNEELAEAIALGHDLGHTPFGHAVEDLFNKEIADFPVGRFYHNEQSVRVVDFLEKRKVDEVGLNLTWEVREGIFKHNNDRSGVYKNLNPKKPCSTLEGQIVGIVDTIAYICHDLEDAILSDSIRQSSLKSRDEKKAFEDFAKLVRELTAGTVEIQYDQGQTFFIRELIHFLVGWFTEDIAKHLDSQDIRTREDVATLAEEGKTVADWSAEHKLQFGSIRRFVYSNIYQSRTIKIMDKRASTMIRALYEAYIEQPELLPSKWYYAYTHPETPAGYPGSEAVKERAVVDYISSMTDRYALDEYDRVFNPRMKL